VKRIPITTKSAQTELTSIHTDKPKDYLPVYCRLIFCGLLFYCFVGGAVRYLVGSCHRSPICDCGRMNGRKDVWRVDSPLPVFLPPKPPEPRMKAVIMFSKITFPLSFSLVSVSRLTDAALPLSNASKSRVFETSVPLVGIGALIDKYCSPCKTFAYHVYVNKEIYMKMDERTGLKFGNQSKRGKDKLKPGITPNVGSASKSLSPSYVQRS
jgi:hypothetical protein